MAYPSPAQNYTEKRLNIGDLVRLSPLSSYLMRSENDYPSVGILKGAILVIERALEPVHLSLVVTEIDNELVIRRFLTTPTLAFQNLGECEEIQRLPIDSNPPIWGVIAYVLNDIAGKGFDF